MKDKPLAAGIAAGTLILTVSLTQVFTRQGFDLSRHPLSLLRLGDFGWIQIANFVTALPGYLLAHPVVGCLVRAGYAVLMGVTAWALLRAPGPKV